MKESISDLMEECSKITLEQKNSEEISSFASALLLLCAIELIAVIALYIKEGFSNNIITYLGILLTMLFFYKWRLSQAEKSVQELAPKSSLDADDLSERINYLSAGMDMKLTRINNIRWFYIIVYPIFFLTVQQLLKGTWDTSYSHWLALVIFCVSYTVWTWFFRGDRNDIETVQTRVSYLAKQANLITKS